MFLSAQVQPAIGPPILHPPSGGRELATAADALLFHELLMPTTPTSTTYKTLIYWQATGMRGQGQRSHPAVGHGLSACGGGTFSGVLKSQSCVHPASRTIHLRGRSSMHWWCANFTGSERAWRTGGNCMLAARTRTGPSIRAASRWRRSAPLHTSVMRATARSMCSAGYAPNARRQSNPTQWH